MSGSCQTCSHSRSVKCAAAASRLPVPESVGRAHGRAAGPSLWAEAQSPRPRAAPRPRCPSFLGSARPPQGPTGRLSPAPEEPCQARVPAAAPLHLLLPRGTAASPAIWNHRPGSPPRSFPSPLLTLAQKMSLSSSVSVSLAPQPKIPVCLLQCSVPAGPTGPQSPGGLDSPEARSWPCSRPADPLLRVTAPSDHGPSSCLPRARWGWGWGRGGTPAERWQAVAAAGTVSRHPPPGRCPSQPPPLPVRVADGDPSDILKELSAGRDHSCSSGAPCRCRNNNQTEVKRSLTRRHRRQRTREGTGGECHQAWETDRLAQTPQKQTRKCPEPRPLPPAAAPGGGGPDPPQSQQASPHRPREGAVGAPRPPRCSPAWLLPSLRPHGSREGRCAHHVAFPRASAEGTFREPHRTWEAISGVKGKVAVGVKHVGLFKGKLEVLPRPRTAQPPPGHTGLVHTQNKSTDQGRAPGLPPTSRPLTEKTHRSTAHPLIAIMPI